MSETDAFKALGQWPIIQAAVALVVIFAGLWLMRRGERDKKPPDPMPQWLMMGPLHDMMMSVHEVAEETRRTNDLLRDIKDVMGDLLRQTEMNKARSRPSGTKAGCADPNKNRRLSRQAADDGLSCHKVLGAMDRRELRPATRFLAT